MEEFIIFLITILIYTLVPIIFIPIMFNIMNKKRELIYIFEHIPEEDLTYEICLKAVKQDGYLIKEIPEKFKDEKMYKTALKYSKGTIDYIPEDMRKEIVKDKLKKYKN